MVDSVFSTEFLKMFCTGYGAGMLKAAALVMGSLFQNLALVMGLPSGLSQAHVYQVPYRSYPPPSQSAKAIECTVYQTQHDYFLIPYFVKLHRSERTFADIPSSSLTQTFESVKLG